MQTGLYLIAKQSPGTGKTIIILALILSTLDQLPSPDDAQGSFRPVMTPVAFRHFHTEEYMQARSGISVKKGLLSHRNSIPSLVELLLHKIRVSPCPTAIRDSEDTLRTRWLLKPLLSNTPFYLDYEDRGFDEVRSKRHERSPGPRVMYITTATLVIVPKHLLSQWKGEIHKHCRDFALRVYAESKEKLPPARWLASHYDVRNAFCLVRFH
jgi:hypothetical protein